jgi:hypothetical protein
VCAVVVMPAKSNERRTCPPLDRRPETHIPSDGFVTLSNEERDKAAARVFSSGRDRLAPRVHRRRAEGAVCLGGYEVALDVENVVDGCMR